MHTRMIDTNGSCICRWLNVIKSKCTQIFIEEAASLNEFDVTVKWINLARVNIKITSILIDSNFFFSFVYTEMILLFWNMSSYHVAAFFYLYKSWLIRRSFKVSIAHFIFIEFYSVLDMCAWANALTHTIPILILITSGNFDALNLNYSYRNML